MSNAGLCPYEMENTPVKDLLGMAKMPIVQMPRIHNSLVLKPRVLIWAENRVATPADTFFSLALEGRNVPSREALESADLCVGVMLWVSKHFTAITFLFEVKKADLGWMRKAPGCEKTFCSKSHNN